VVRFTANTVVVDSSIEGVTIVGFADERDGACANALQFRRSHTFDEQDVALGMDSVYVERDDQRRGGYGGVERVELHPRHVRVTIGAKLAERIGDSDFEVAFSLSPEDFARLREGLRKVFAGFSSFAECRS
jgi:hypothetical protein